jgi:hypothetical protein
MFFSLLKSSCVKGLNGVVRIIYQNFKTSCVDYLNWKRVYVTKTLLPFEQILRSINFHLKMKIFDLYELDIRGPG